MALLCDCATLTAIPAGICGNGVIDPNEDCDGIDPTCGSPTSGTTACRLTCDPKGTAACAPGSGCGVDGICRKRTGKLSTAGAPVSTNAFTLLAGDFDGDRRTDIVGSPPFGGSGGSRVHYFGSTGALATTTTLNIPIPLGIVRDLDGDKLDDLGFAARGLVLGAFGGLGGRRDRSFSTLVFPAVTFPELDARLAIVTASATVTLPDDTSACAIGLLGVGSVGNLVNLCNSAVSGDTNYDVRVGFGPRDIVGEPHAGRTKLTKSVCGEVIFGTNTAAGGRVWVAGPCNDKVGNAGWSKEPPLELAVDGKLERVYVGPLSAPGTDDIFVQTSTGLYVLIDGKFQTTELLKSAKALPLASGDLDGDGLIDFVFPSAIALTTLSPFGVDAGNDRDAGSDPSPKRLILPRDQLQWSAAQIGRFNNDDLPDLLVSFPQSLDVDVLLNGGLARFTPFTVRSEHPVKAIMAGDYDGDRITDVAFLQGTKELGPGSESDLVIAYGSATGGPEPPQVVGRFKDGRTLGALRNQVTSVDDIGVLETGPAATSLTVLVGSGGRQQVAPLFMSDTDAKEPLLGGRRPNKKEPVRVWQPVSFNVGAFKTPGTLEIMSIATGFLINPTGQAQLLPEGFRTGAWLAASAPSGTFTPFTQLAALDQFTGIDESRLRNGGTIELGTVTTAGDVDVPANGIEEIVSLTRTPGGAAVFVVRVGSEAPPSLAAMIPEAVVTGGEPIKLVDLDGDRTLDLVVVARVGGLRKLHVLRGDGRGAFGAPTVLALPEEPLAFTTLDTGGKHVDLAVATSTKVYLASFDAVREVPLGVAAPKLSAIVAGDVDGDGVPDLAIADGGAIRILLQEPGLK